MNKYVFLVPNNKVERITVVANTEEEAREKLYYYEVEEEETEHDDYDFAGATLDEVEEDV